jgi:hypothetical protein
VHKTPIPKSRLATAGERKRYLEHQDIDISWQLCEFVGECHYTILGLVTNLSTLSRDDTFLKKGTYWFCPSGMEIRPNFVRLRTVQSMTIILPAASFG